MIAENHQKKVRYHKEYPCYSITTHLSEHRQRQFANVTAIQFSKPTSPTIELPKYLIDKFQVPEQMYWLEWRTQEIHKQIIQQARNNKNIKSAQNNGSSLVNRATQSRGTNRFRCLYIAQLGKMAHVKLVFNYDPQLIAISRDYLYTLGGNQLIITQLWPQTLIQTKNIDSATQLPPKQNQIIHKLDQQSKVLSLDFVYSELHQVQCKIIYFHQKKGLYSQTYNKDNLSGGDSILNKILDISSLLKKNQTMPLFYKTIVPNILGIQILNTEQFILVNLSTMKTIPSTRTKLNWSLNQNHPIIIKHFKNIPHEGFNDCLSIAIGQGNNIQIFFYHIKFSDSATLISPLDNKRKSASQIKQPISSFTSAQFIDFQRSFIKQFSVINLQRITHLKSFILSAKGIIYLGYNKNAVQIGQSDQLPLSGFVNYETPYITNQILMQENKIWRQYKIDLLLHKSQQQKNNSFFNYSNNLYRLLIPGRYDKWFIMKVLSIEKITDINKLIQDNKKSFNQINQMLVFQWKKQYQFVEFVYFKDEYLIIRKNSIGTIAAIKQDQFLLENDKFSEQQINYNELQSKGFSMHHDFQGNQYIDEQFNINQHKYQSNSQAGNNMFRGKTYDQKIKFINAYLEHYTQSTWFENGIQGQRSIIPKGYFDAKQVKKYSQLYKSILNQILALSQSQNIQKLKQTRPFSAVNSFTSQLIPQNNNIQQTKLLLHLQILCLKLKNKLSYYLISLKSYYHYYFEYVVEMANNRLNRKNEMEIEEEREYGYVNNKKGIITPQMLQKIHLRHIYIVFVLEWIVNIGQRSVLQKQYECFDRDLVDQFVYEYVNKYCNSQTGILPANRKNSGYHNRLYKEDIPIHIKNIMSLLFKGLVSLTRLKSEEINISQIVSSNIAMKGDLLIQECIENINKKSSPFVLMLLKKHNQIKQKSDFIANTLLMSLYKPLILQPFNQNIASYVNVNKVLIYSILNLPLKKQQKMSILSSYLDSKQFICLLLLIQLQNNCHLTKQQDGLHEVFAKKGEQYFQSNSLRLSRQNCYILEEIILINYKTFMLPTRSQPNELKKKAIKQCKYISKISDSQLLVEENDVREQKCIQFIKYLFSDIDFKYLSSVLTKDQKKKHPQGHKNNINEEMNNEESSYYNKNIAQVLRQLLKQVQQINQEFSCNKQSKIQRTFSKYYTKIHKKPSPSHMNRSSTYCESKQTYPQMTGQGYGLSLWQLQKINKLYRKHLQSLKNQSKHHFSVDTIQKRQNLQYSMLKIYLFRLKCALKQIESSTDFQRFQYAEIMKQCTQRLEESLKLFKRCLIELSYGKFDNDMAGFSDEQVLQILKKTQIMENINFYSLSQQTGKQEQQLNQKWSIIGKPLSQNLLQLFKLTFQYDQQGRSKNQTKRKIFTNYHSMDSIMYKMLRQIKIQNKSKQYQIMQNLFDKQIINELITGNQQLKQLYQPNKFTSTHFSRNTFSSQNIGGNKGMFYEYKKIK